MLRRILIATTGRNTGHFVIGVSVEEERDRVARLVARIIISEMLDAEKIIVSPELQ